MYWSNVQTVLTSFLQDTKEHGEQSNYASSLSQLFPRSIHSYLKFIVDVYLKESYTNAFSATVNKQEILATNILQLLTPTGKTIMILLTKRKVFTLK